MPAVKDVGEPCEEKPHARFDGGREETNASRPRRAASGASRLPDRGLVLAGKRQELNDRHDHDVVVQSAGRNADLFRIIRVLE